MLFSYHICICDRPKDADNFPINFFYLLTFLTIIFLTAGQFRSLLTITRTKYDTVMFTSADSLVRLTTHQHGPSLNQSILSRLYWSAWAQPVVSSVKFQTKTDLASASGHNSDSGRPLRTSFNLTFIYLNRPQDHNISI